MSILTKAGRKKLEDDEMENYLLEEKQRLEGIQASIELQKKRGNYDASIILQAQLNDMMGISNSNIDTSQAERDIGNLLKKNIETSLNANKKIEGITTNIKGIDELKKEIENDKAVEKKKKLANITSNLKKLERKNAANVIGKKFKANRAQALAPAPAPEAGGEPIHDRFVAEVRLQKQHINGIESGIDNLRDHTIEPALILTINEDLEEVIRGVGVYKQGVRGVAGRDAKKVRDKLVMLEKRVVSLKGRLNRLKLKPEYAGYFGVEPAGGAQEEKAGEPAPAVVAPAPPPPPPPAPPADEQLVIPIGGMGLPRMYSLLRKKATKKGRGIAMQEVLSNFHHKPLYFNTKVKKARQIILKDEKEKLENLINKYDILTGEILAGNNNKQLLIQLKSLITRLVNLKKLDSDVAHEVLQQLQLIK